MTNLGQQGLGWAGCIRERIWAACVSCKVQNERKKKSYLNLIHLKGLCDGTKFDTTYQGNYYLHQVMWSYSKITQASVGRDIQLMRQRCSSTVTQSSGSKSKMFKIQKIKKLNVKKYRK